jgi:hypothetical protein
MLPRAITELSAIEMGITEFHRESKAQEATYPAGKPKDVAAVRREIAIGLAPFGEPL